MSIAALMATSAIAVSSLRQSARHHEQVLDHQIDSVERALDDNHPRELWSRQVDAYVRLAEWLSALSRVERWDDVSPPDDRLMAELEVIAHQKAYARLAVLIGQLRALSSTLFESVAAESPEVVRAVRQESLDLIKSKIHEHVMMLREFVQLPPEWGEPIAMRPESRRHG